MFVTTMTSTLLNQMRNNLSKVSTAIASSYRPLSISNDDEETIQANYSDVENKEPWWPPKKPPFVSVWERPKCCDMPCDSYRHDVIFLRPKPTRKYKRTWVECEPVKKMKRICNSVLPPEYEIRPKRITTKLGTLEPCIGNEIQLNLMTCLPPPKLNDPCSRIRIPGCKLPRIPPKCIRPTIPKCCQKRCTMYPSYSECKMKKPPVKPPIECLCLKIPSTCEVFAMYRKFPIK